VNPAANKHQIKDAIERQYNVKVTDVRTMNRKGKPRRSKFKMTTTSDWKRAVVVLDENSRIELF
jgi:large subunit ribosomal protein L23